MTALVSTTLLINPAQKVLGCSYGIAIFVNDIKSEYDTVMSEYGIGMVDCNI